VKSSGKSGEPQRKSQLKDERELSAALAEVKRKRIALGTLSVAQKYDIAARSADLPNVSALKRAQVAEWLAKLGEAVNPYYTLAALKQVLQRAIAKMPSEVEALAAAEGHKVVFTPAYHSNLHPMELCRAHVKDIVAQQCRAGASVSVVKERLIALLGAGLSTAVRRAENCARTTTGLRTPKRKQKWQETERRSGKLLHAVVTRRRKARKGLLGAARTKARPGVTTSTPR
jgi:hypothetical protein